MFFAFYAKIQDGRQKWRKNYFGKSHLQPLQIPCGSKISSKSPHLVPLNVFLCFTKKFNIAAKNGGENEFWESGQLTTDTLWVKNFVKIALSRTVSKIKAFLPFYAKI